MSAVSTRRQAATRVEFGMMPAHSWDDAEALFAEATDLRAAERDMLLATRCNGRPELRAEVESLLVCHDEAGPFLRSPTGGPTAAPNALSACGRTVGRFRLLDKIGEGGMGVVYRGERADGEFVERVAIKLLPIPFQSEDAFRRFRMERQILASLNHPDIVALIDSGVSDVGQAFLAMTYVEGAPITEYCARRALPLQARLRLFQRICAAVQYAHQNGVVHRDLKPANILVTAEGNPKVLDFGVAKLLDRAGQAIDAKETTALRPFTPNYASPEQLRGLAVTAACDVYALGVLLYEMLSGSRPYDVSATPLDEMLATVVEREPPRPSSAVTSARLPYEPRRLKGDIDAIVRQAMCKDARRRYASPQEFSEDISRHLAGEPVLAREPSIFYVMSTLARRHRPVFSALAISVAALAVSVWQTRIVVAERNHAVALLETLAAGPAATRESRPGADPLEACHRAGHVLKPLLERLPDDGERPRSVGLVNSSLGGTHTSRNAKPSQAASR